MQSEKPNRLDSGADRLKAGAACVVLGLIAGGANAQTAIETTFSTAEGFTIGGTAPVDLSSGNLTLTVSGGQQQQSFDGPSYNDGPDAYLFVSGPSFTGSLGGTAVGTGDTGDLTFSRGVTDVSFFAADRGMGTPTVRVFGTDDTTVLAEVAVTGTSNRTSAGAVPLTFSAQELGGLIGRVEIDNAGPASNPPYVTAIDTLSAVRANRYDESVNGDFANTGAVPTAVDLELGSNVIAGSVSAGAGDTRDFFTFSIEEGQSLEAINLLEYDDPDVSGTNDGNRGFYALVEGAVASTPGSGFANLGGDHLDPEPFGTNLLDAIALGGISGGTGFSELAAGEYTFVIQQTGPQISDYVVDFVVVPEPASLTLLGLASLTLVRRRRR